MKPRTRPSDPCGVGADLKASPLPPAPLADSGLLICELEGSAGLKGFAGLERFAALKTLHQEDYHVFTGIGFVDFDINLGAQGDRFGSIWRSLETILASF